MIKLLEENIREYLHNFGIGKYLLEKTPDSVAIWNLTNQTSKLKTFCS